MNFLIQMKKRAWTLLMVCCLCMLSVLPVSAEEVTDSYKVYTTANLRVRTGPSVSDKQIGLLSRGTEVTVIDELENGWLLIEYDDGQAYCNGDYTSDTYTVYTKVALNVRNEPSADAKCLGTFKCGEKVFVLEKLDNGWLKVEYDNGYAYCNGKYTSVNPVSTSVVMTTTDAGVVTPGICEKDGSATDYWMNRVNQELAYVPENVKSAFVNRGWHIYITDKNIAQTWFSGVYNSVQGVTSYNTRSIYIEQREAAMEAPVHEIGHFVDAALGYPSQSSEFAGIYNAEVGVFKAGISNPGCVSDTRELFAEGFYYLCKNPSKVTPQLKSFLEARVGMI